MVDFSVKGVGVKPVIKHLGFILSNLSVSNSVPNFHWTEISSISCESARFLTCYF